MTRFFTISDNSFYNRGYPWIMKVVGGIHEDPTACPECGTTKAPSFSGDLTVVLDRNNAYRWPDALGSGATCPFIVSERVVEDWKADGVGDFPVGGRIRFLDPLPARLRGSRPPKYVWVDGTEMAGAVLDYEASGFVGIRYCPTCGRRRWNISATYDRQHSQPWGYVFVEGSWKGVNLFGTVPVADGVQFCTEKVVECAAKHRHTNFRFEPIDEQQNAASTPGIDYLSGKTY